MDARTNASGARLSPHRRGWRPLHASSTATSRLFRPTLALGDKLLTTQHSVCIFTFVRSLACLSRRPVSKNPQLCYQQLFSIVIIARFPSCAPPQANAKSACNFQLPGTKMSSPLASPSQRVALAGPTSVRVSGPGAKFNVDNLQFKCKAAEAAAPAHAHARPSA